jgi:hypothetical protein
MPVRLRTFSRANLARIKLVKLVRAAMVNNRPALARHWNALRVCQIVAALKQHLRNLRRLGLRDDWRNHADSLAGHAE